VTDDDVLLQTQQIVAQAANRGVRLRAAVSCQGNGENDNGAGTSVVAGRSTTDDCGRIVSGRHSARVAVSSHAFTCATTVLEMGM
jgi:hypothetical protein